MRPSYVVLTLVVAGAAIIAALGPMRGRSVQSGFEDLHSTITATLGTSGSTSAAKQPSAPPSEVTVSRPISRNVIEAAKGTSEVASSITAVNAGAAETGSASSQVLASAKALSTDSRTLRSEVDRFLATVRAA